MKKLLLPLFIILLAVSSGVCQTVDQLQEQIRKAEEEIRITDQLLKKTEKDQQNNRSQLRLVENNIKNRRSIVSDLDQQISLTNREIDEKNQTITELENELSVLKEEYAAMIRSGYKNYRLNNIMAFIFASRDFSDMARRIYYIRRYTLAREQKAQAIDSLATRLITDIVVLDSAKIRLDSTKQTRNEELSKLSREERKYREIDQSLRSKASEYDKKIKTQRTQIENMQKQIEKIIAEEARKSQAAQTTMSAAEKEVIVKLTGRFDENKGKLPYPVSGGVVIDKFGVHRDPNNPEVQRDNQGVTIAAERGAAVRCVFDGEVSRIALVPGLNNSVLIRHGDYLTVYSNLETVHVKPGDKVSTNQVIGNIYSGPNAESYFLHFSLWKGGTKYNPEQWIRR